MSRPAQRRQAEILQGVRRVCKLATVEISLADYAKKKVPKSVDLPFTKEATVLFYAGIVSAGFGMQPLGSRQSRRAPGAHHAAAAASVDRHPRRTINRSRV
jgi:hypothetical protein